MERNPHINDKVVVVTTLTNNKNKVPLIGEVGSIRKVYTFGNFPYVITFYNPKLRAASNSLCWSDKEFILLDSDNTDYTKEQSCLT